MVEAGPTNNGTVVQLLNEPPSNLLQQTIKEEIKIPEGKNYLQIPSSKTLWNGFWRSTEVTCEMLLLENSLVIRKIFLWAYGS